MCRLLIVPKKISFTEDELKELANLMETQNTTDRLTEGVYHIDGHYACISVKVDDDGDVEII